MALFTPQQRQTALWTGIGILLIAILLLLGPILTPFIAGSILAYALNPIVEWLRSKRLGNLRMPRIIAVIIVLAMNLVGSLLISALVIFPALSAMRIFKSFRGVTICAAVLSVFCSLIGILVSILAGTPVGSTIVAVQIGAFVLSWLTGIALQR